MARTNKGSDSGASALAAMLQEVQGAERSGQTLTTPEIIRMLRRRGYTKNAIGFALTAFEQYAGGEYDPGRRHEALRKDIRRSLKVAPPRLR